MAISYIGSSAALANSVTLPGHQSGDVLIITTRRSGSTTPPSLPVGWTNIEATGTSNVGVRTGYKIAASGSEVSGTWTNAAVIIASVYRGASDIGAHTVLAGTNNPPSDVPALTLQVTDGTSWVYCGNGRAAASGSEPSEVVGMVLRQEGTVATPRGAALDTNGGVSSWSGGASDMGSSTGWVHVVVELKAVSGTPTPLALTLGITA